MQARARNIVLRVIVAPVIPVTALVPIELLYVGTTMILVSRTDPEGYLWLAGGLICVAICAAAIKFVFNLRIWYWVLFLLVLAAVIGTIVYKVGTIFF